MIDARCIFLHIVFKSVFKKSARVQAGSPGRLYAKASRSAKVQPPPATLRFASTSAELLPQSDTQLLSERKCGLLQRIQSDRDIFRVQQTIHGSPACPHLSRHLNLGQSLFPHLLLDLEGEHTLSSDCFAPASKSCSLRKSSKFPPRCLFFILTPMIFLNLRLAVWSSFSGVSCDF